MRDIIKKLQELNVEKEQLDEGHMSDMAHEAEKDHEVQMARSDLYKAAKYAVSIHKMMKDVSEMEGIDGWVASKITKASDYLGSVKHYMEGQMMQDVELAVVPVAGDMTDAMTMPQESIEEVHESINEGFGPPSNGAKNIQELISKMGADTPGDIIADIMHWADENDMEFSDLVRQGTMYYNDEKMMYNDDVDEEVTEGRLGFRDIAKFGSEMASRIDQEARRRGSADMEPGDADRLRYRIAKAMGLVETEVTERMAPAGGRGKRRNKPSSNTSGGGQAAGKARRMAPTLGVPAKQNAMGESIVTEDEEEDKKPDMGALLKALKKKLSDEGGAAGFDPLEKIAKDMGVDLTPAMLKGMAGIKMHRDGDYILEDTLEEKDEDVIGDIIASLSKTKERMPMPTSKPKMSMVTKQKAMNKMALPKSKPDMSMAQDTTRPLTMSKFSEWSKK